MKIKTKSVTNERQRAHLEDQSRSLPARLRPLEEKLLSLGGSFALVRHNEPDAEKILARGERLSGRGAVLKVVEHNRCHTNAARLWLAAPARFEIMTGYALSSDGLWRQHSWVRQRKDGKLIETTERRVLYFGFALEDGHESSRFVDANMDRGEIREILKRKGS